MSVEREPDTVTVVEDDELGPSRPKRVGSAALLEAIRALPDAVAERLEGHQPADGDGDGRAPEVTFVGDPPPDEAEPEAAGPGAPPSASPDPAVHRAQFKHPSRRKRRAEAIV